MKPAESFVAQPVRALQTMLRVIAQNDPRMPSVVPDGIYGPGTMNAVTVFQRLYGFSVTGVTNQALWDKIEEVYQAAHLRVCTPLKLEISLEPGETLSQGDSSPYLFVVQGMLTQLSKSNPSIPEPSHTGVMDPETVSSLLEFQKLAGIPADGALSQEAWKHLSLQFTLSAHHSQSRQNHSLANL